MKKKFMFTLLTILLIVTSSSLYGNGAVTNESIGTVDEVLEKVIVETIVVDKHFIIKSTYNPTYHEIRTIVMYNHVNEINDGVLENYYQEYIYKWIRNNDHRYYDYLTVYRQKFYNKSINNGRYNTYELYTILKR